MSFEPTSVLPVTRIDPRLAQDRGDVTADSLEEFARAAPTSILFVTDTSNVASDYIFASGREVLPIVPVITPGHDPRIAWIRTHCRVIKIDPPAAIRFGVHDGHTTV